MVSEEKYVMTSLSSYLSNYYLNFPCLGVSVCTRYHILMELFGNNATLYVFV